ncbi:MAG: hypothetical protein IJD70_10105 [Clostridia bacterium]|nr:hypothetical protein [Clostridia bacterium]
MKNERKNPQIILIVLGAAVGLILLLWGSFGGEREVGKISDTSEIESYCAYLEGQAVRLCESVKGVSDVTVALTLDGGFEQIYAADKTMNGNSQSIEHVKLGSGSGAELCAVSVAAPKVIGIGITCRGGKNDSVRAELTALLSAAFGVGANKIYITEAG